MKDPAVFGSSEWAYPELRVGAAAGLRSPSSPGGGRGHAQVAGPRFTLPCHQVEWNLPLSREATHAQPGPRGVRGLEPTGEVQGDPVTPAGAARHEQTLEGSGERSCVCSGRTPSPHCCVAEAPGGPVPSLAWAGWDRHVGEPAPIVCPLLHPQTHLEVLPDHPVSRSLPCRGCRLGWGEICSFPHGQMGGGNPWGELGL